MQLPQILQAVFVVFSIFTACYSLTRWRQPHMMYFAYLALAVCFVNTGFFFEITAANVETAIVACKFQYLGNPFVGVFFYLFTRDYLNIPVRPTWKVFSLLALPVFVAAMVFTWPTQHLYYEALELVDVAGGARALSITPGPMYYFNFAYSLLMSVLACGTVLLHPRAVDVERKHTIIIFLGAIIPTVVQVLYLFKIFPAGWDILPASLSFYVTVLGAYILMYRQREWQSFGRELVVENMKDAYILLDTKDRFLDANSRAKEYFPLLNDVQIGDAVSKIENFPKQLLSQEDVMFTIGNGEEAMHARSSRSPLMDGDDILGNSIMIYDDTENHHLMQELQQLATHDALTALYNRGTFFNYARRDFSLSTRKREAGSVLMMDIDHFKKVNDEHGHACGDKVLIAVASILLDRLRHTDICGRYGGEELSVWLPGAPSEGAAMIADVIRRAVEHTTFSSENGSFHVTISIGVSSIDYSRKQSFDDVVNEADAALYQAKNGGRNQVRVYQLPS